MAGANHNEIVNLLRMLPKTEFAFYYNHVSRISSGNRLIVAVDDLKKFHHENIRLNKSHYPITGRLLKEKFIAYFSKYGARIHFNTFKLENQKPMKYGIIRKIDLIQDLNLWETLCASSFLMRPVNILQKDKDIEAAQKNNLRSACAFSGLMTKNGCSEVEFYKNIVTVPHYQSYSKYFRLVDDEDLEQIVINEIDKFREIYEPIIQSNFKDSFVINDGIFQKDESNRVKKFLLSNLNDNAHQNLFKIASPLKYDTEKKFHKTTMKSEEVYDKIDEQLSKLTYEELQK